MSAQTIEIAITAVLFLHGLAHGGVLVALFAQSRGIDTGTWQPAQSWLFPSLTASTATIIASIFWLVSLIGFIVVALSFWGLLIPGDMWRQLAVASAIVSILGIVLFFRTWPMFNTFAALGVNITVLVTQLWFYWPPSTM